MINKKNRTQNRRDPISQTRPNHRESSDKVFNRK